MKVVLDYRLFQRGDAECVEDLTALLLAANRSPHQVVIDGGAEGQRGWERWLVDHHRPVLGKSLASILARGRAPEFLRKPPAITLRVSDDVDESIDPQGLTACACSSRARDLVDKPLDLWLENDDNDSVFLRTVAPAGDFRAWLEQAKDKRWVAYRHGGGSDLKNKLEALDPWERLRSWAMCDADTWEPQQRSSQVVNLEAICAGRSSGTSALNEPPLPLRVLRRRAIENYLPVRALKHWANLRPHKRERSRKQLSFAQAVAMLDAHAARFNLRHHYHLENGFQVEPGKIPKDYEPFRTDPVLFRGIGPSIKSVYQSNLEAMSSGGRGWIRDEWFAEDESMRDEIVQIIESIRSRI